MTKITFIAPECHQRAHLVLAYIYTTASSPSSYVRFSFMYFYTVLEVLEICAALFWEALRYSSKDVFLIYGSHASINWTVGNTAISLKVYYSGQ